MTGWEVLGLLLQMLALSWLGLVIFLCVWVTVTHVGQAMKARANASRAWQEGYEQGVHDERQAAEVDIPEYRIPRRQNPYGASAKN